MPFSSLNPELKRDIFKVYLDWNSRYQISRASKELYSFYSTIVVPGTLTISSKSIKNVNSQSLYFFLRSTCLNLKVDFGESPLTTDAFYKIVTMFRTLNTVSLDYKTKSNESTLSEVTSIIAAKAKHIYISVPLKDFLLVNNLMQEKKSNMYCLGVLQGSHETDPSTRRVLLDRDDLNTMSRYQLKRPIDLIQPSPAVEDSIKRLKDTLVTEELKNGNAYKLIERSQTELLAKPLLTIAESSARYEHLASPVLQNIADGILPVNVQGLETAMKSLGQAFMEAIIVNGVDFVLITQFDVFLSNQPALDDCAYPVQTKYLSTFEVGLKQKTRFKSSWNELIIQNGQHQILVTGGLFGTYGSSAIQPFLGSSFPFSFSGESYNCYINRFDSPLKQQQRYLIDYKKSNANLLAGFISRRFSILGFEAAHPLYYGNTVPVGPRPQLSHIASRILCYYSSNHCTSEDVVDLLQNFLRTTAMTTLLERKKRITKCSELSFLLKKNISKLITNIIQKLIAMEKITDTTSPARISSLDHENEEDGTKLRDLVNNGLASSIKNANKVVMKRFVNSNIENQ